MQGSKLHIGSSQGFSVLLKDTLTLGEELFVIELATFRWLNDSSTSCRPSCGKSTCVCVCVCVCVCKAVLVVESVSVCTTGGRWCMSLMV